MSTIRTRYRLRRSARLVEHGGNAVLTAPRSLLDCRHLSPAQLDLIRRLATSEVPGDDPAEVAVIQPLDRALWLTTSVYEQDTPLFRSDPVTSASEFRRVAERDGSGVVAGAATTFSRFVTVTPSAEGFVVESPLSTHRVVITDARAWSALFALAAGTDAAADGVTRVLSAELARLGLLQPAGGPETTELGRRQWSRCDLLLHTRSRRGRHENPSGGTLWARGSFEPPPAVPSPLPGAEIPLRVPAAPPDAPLFEVLDTRVSVRRHGTRPITVDQLGEFLYRCARVETRVDGDGRTRPWRPYPSGGGTYELELYVNASDVDGLERGLYRYAGDRHALETVSRDAALVRRLAADAQLSASSTGEPAPQVVILLAARFGRVMWKYESIGYAVVLKDVGVLFSTMYQVATALGLAPCALGTGNSDLFSLARGVPYHEETTVGEFLLGSRPD
ncbi:SagB family peptide dehydrogenase [Cryptosporangium japonicum]|uniref:SagB family peptide dehydrogenase n=1 Tax=Cryptosporangium japonicum TaxID=80872 RepID=A0ABN0U8F5_9ACTN